MHSSLMQSNSNPVEGVIAFVFGGIVLILIGQAMTESSAVNLEAFGFLSVLAGVTIGVASLVALLNSFI